MTVMGLEFFIWTILTLTEPFAVQQQSQWEAFYLFYCQFFIFLLPIFFATQIIGGAKELVVLL